MDKNQTLFLALSWLLFTNLAQALECYHCAGMRATINAAENNYTDEIKKTIGGVSLTNLSFHESCMSTNPKDLQLFKNNNYCAESCAYINMTLTNDNYKNKGKLILTGTIRRCQVCFFS